MNANEVRWHLHNYFEDIKKIERLKTDLKEYRLMDGVKAQIITDMPVCHGTNSKIESTLIKEYRHKNKEGLELSEYIMELENELDSLMRARKAIDDVYRYLREPSRTIIEMRYFITPMENDVRKPKYNWLYISQEVGYSEKYCKKIDGQVVFSILDKLHKR